MDRINFLFGIHDHQPVGNFEWVFEESYQKCYKPFLDVLEKHPKVRCAMHHTGPLLEWIEQNRPKYLDRLRKLVESKQIELLGGAFYEPILPIIPEKDAIGQIQYMSQYLKEKFGVTPKGMWLAERVWEPHLPSILKKAGIEYTLTDDTHFSFSGLRPSDMVGYYVTENAGATLNIFPIDKNLRYLIPFKQPEETIQYLRSISAEVGNKAVSMADDGEKFGLWPGTHDWVYNQGYLERLFRLLEENSDWIGMPTYQEYLRDNPSTGRVYLPTASYYEMMEWALPSHSATEYQHMVKSLTDSNLYDRYKVFLRGGFWRNFLVKYKESHLMRSKMCWISGMVDKAKANAGASSTALKEAQKDLWRGQCNCPYWHGLFGGIYLNYLRYAIYSHLLKAETACDKIIHGAKNWVSVDRLDYDMDGQDEILISGARANAYLDPDYGGALVEWDCKPKFFNVTDTITRREESYHRKILEAQRNQPSGDQPKSIHDIVHVKEAGLENILFYDWYNRHSFLDHFLGQEADLESFKRCKYPEEGDFVNQPYKVMQIGNKELSASVHLRRQGHLYRCGKKHPLQVDKTYAMEAKGVLRVSYEIQNLGNAPADFWFGSEMNLTLLAGNEADRYYVLGSQTGKKPRLGSEGACEDMDRVSLVDEYTKIRINIEADPNASLWRFPIETVSQSESGFERTYQGSCLLFHWKFALQPKEAKRLEIAGHFSEL